MVVSRVGPLAIFTPSLEHWKHRRFRPGILVSMWLGLYGFSAPLTVGDSGALCGAVASSFIRALTRWDRKRRWFCETAALPSSGRARFMRMNELTIATSGMGTGEEKKSGSEDIRRP